MPIWSSLWKVVIFVYPQQINFIKQDQAPSGISPYKLHGHNSLSHFLENKFISCIGILICIQCLLLYRAHTYTKKKIVEHKNVNIMNLIYGYIFDKHKFINLIKFPIGKQCATIYSKSLVVFPLNFI